MYAARQDRVEPVRRLGPAKLFADFRTTQEARHRRQRPEVIGTGFRRSEQGENQIDWTVIQGVELQRLFQLEEDAGHLSDQVGERERPDAGALCGPRRAMSR